MTKKGRLLMSLISWWITIAVGLVLPLSPLTVYAQNNQDNSNNLPDVNFIDETEEAPDISPNMSPIDDTLLDSSTISTPDKPYGLDNTLCSENNTNNISSADTDDSSPFGDCFPTDGKPNVAVDEIDGKTTYVFTDTTTEDTNEQQGQNDTPDTSSSSSTGEPRPGFPGGLPEDEGSSPTTSPTTSTQSSSTNRSFASIPNISSSTPSRQTAGQDPGYGVIYSPLATYVSNLHDQLKEIADYEVRLNLSATDKAALFGEKCSGGLNDRGTCDTFDPTDDIIPNSHWDPPRVDKRVIEMLNYLFKPRKEGGAGREYLAISRIISFNKNETEQTQNKPEPYTDNNGNGKYDQGEPFTDLNNNGQWDSDIEGTNSPHYISINTDPGDPNYVSQAMDISAIDRIRITTVVKHRGVVSSNKFTYQPPIPIKVAWQSNEGIQRSPLPDISVPENLQDLVFGGVYGWLADQGLLNDPNLSGRPLESLSTADLARFVGGRLLQQLLNGEDISKFNFGDTIRDFGVLALAGAFNIDAEAIRHANSLEGIEEWEGRAIISKQLNLEKPLEGNTPDELYQSVAKQYLAKLLGTQPYIFDNYNGVDEFKKKLGQGKIERLLKVPDHTFDSDSFSEIKKALGNRFSLIFELNMGGFGQPDTSVDEELGITTGTTKRFLTGQLSPTDYKKAVGETVWNSSVGAYNPGTFTPLPPEKIVQQLNNPKATNGNNANIGNLTAAVEGLSTFETAHNQELNEQALTGNPDRLKQLQDIKDLQIGINTLKSSLDAAARQYSSDRTGFIESLGSSGVSSSKIYKQIDDLKENVVNAQAAVEINEKEKNISPGASNGGIDFLSLFNMVGSQLQSARDTLTNYQNYGANPDNSSQLRDQMYNLPAGTWWTVIGGGNGLKAALSQAGRWLVGQRLPAGSERDGFINNPAAAFQPSNAVLNDTISVFQAPLPQYEFRRIGREQILTNISQSAEVQSLKATGFAREIFFYTDRLEIIRQSLVTIRQSAASLQGSVPADWQQTINKLIDNYSIDPKGVTSMGSLGLIKQNKGDLYGVINLVKQSGSLNGVNQILAASRNIERAIMEISSGNSVSYNSSNSIIPTDLSIPDIDPNKIPGQSTQNIDPVNGIINSDTLVRSAAFKVLAGGDFQQVIFNLGAQSLANLLSLPTNTIYYFQQGAQDMDSFFAAVGEAQENQGVVNPTAQQKEAYIKRGREYIANYTIPGLARRLNIGLPDWLPPEAIANIVMGNPDKALVSIGGAQIENLVGLPHGFVSQIVYPPGETGTEREMNRERAMISALLSKMDIELDLPPGFMLTNNPVQSMGAARIESILGLKSGEFRGTPTDISTHLGLGTTTGDANLIQSYERFINIFGIELAGDATTAKQKISEITNDEEALQRARNQYRDVLETAIKTVLKGENFNGTNADQRQADFRQRLNYLDNRLGFADANATNGEPGKPMGTTQKWLTGAISTDDYINQAGTQSAVALGSQAFGALLQRIGAPDGIVKIFKDNTNEIIDLFQWGTGKDPNKKEWGPAQFAEVFDIVNTAFSFDIDSKLHLTDGTIAKLMRHPEDAGNIMIDQGVRLLAEQIFNLDLSGNDPTRNDDPVDVFVGVLQNAILHSIYNPDTDRFEPQNFNLQYFATQVYDPLANYAQSQLIGLIPDATARQYFSVPLTHLFAVFRGDLASMNILPRYASLANGLNQTMINGAGATDPNDFTNRQFPTLADAGNLAINTDTGSSEQLSITEKIAKNLEDTTGEDTTGQDLAKLDYLANAGTNAEANNEPTIEAVSATYLPPYDSAKKLTNFSADANKKMGDITNKMKISAQASLVVSTDYAAVGKEFGYALGDFGLTKLLNKYNVMPGLTRTLMSGTPQERVSALAGMAAGYLLQNYHDEVHAALGNFTFLLEPASVDAIVNLAMNWGKSFNITDQTQRATYNQTMTDFRELVDRAGSALWETLGIKDELGKKALSGFLDYSVGLTDLNSFLGLSSVSTGGVKDDSLLGIAFQYGDKILGLNIGSCLEVYNDTVGLYNAVNDYVNLSSNDFVVATSAGSSGGAITGNSVSDQKFDNLVGAAVKLGLKVIDLAFGKEIAKFEQSIGLPAGTITKAIGLAIEGFFGGFANPQYWWKVAEFLITTILGFGWTSYEVKATADGYYPFVGKLGQFVPPNDPRVKAKNRVPYIQWPSADILSDDGQLATGEALGEFDPTKQASKVAGFQAAAQSKVRGLLIDLFSTSDRATANGYSEGAKDITGTPWNQQIMPIQVFVHQFNNQDGVTQYVNDPTIMGLRDQYRPLTLDGQTTNWGIGARPEYWDVVHVAW